MKYTTYYEDRLSFTSEQYEQLKEVLLSENSKKEVENINLKKIRFINTAEYIQDPEDDFAKYYICIENHNPEKIYVEKKSKQNELYYKTIEPVTKTECEKIVKREIEWMKGHKRPLLNDLYMQITINKLEPGYITEYTRERIECSKNALVIFDTDIRRAVGKELDLFSNTLIYIPCLNEDRVYANFKRKYTIPTAITNILQQQEEQSETNFA